MTSNEVHFVSLADNLLNNFQTFWNYFLEWKTKLPNGPDNYRELQETGPWSEFVLPWHRLDTRSVNFLFFSILFLYFFQRLRYLFKKQMHIGCVKLGTDYLQRLLWRRSIERQSKYHSHRKEMCSITALSTNILSIVFKYLVACLVVERHYEALINP